MTPRLVIYPAAAADIDEAYRWYEQARQGLGDEFLSAIRASLDAVIEGPLQFPVVYRDARRALVRRFPFAVFFRNEGDAVVVVACFHGSRGPRTWQRRTAREDR